MGVEVSPSCELGSLQACLVGGDTNQRAFERRTRRKSLFLSVLLQAMICAAIVLFPLFARPARISQQTYIPLPPYRASAVQRTTERSRALPNRPRPSDPRFFDFTRIPQTIPRTNDPVDDRGPDLIPGIGEGPVVPGAIPTVESNNARRPIEPPRVETPKTVHVTQIDPAMLKVRIEPIYPTLMKQIGRSGQVQLRAIIGTDGTIQSLQVISGDPGFYQSALEAVRQWRYKPTILNGNPVEVDTFITVIYNIGR